MMRYWVLATLALGCGPVTEVEENDGSTGEASLPPGSCAEPQLPPPACTDECVGLGCCEACTGLPTCGSLDDGAAIATCSADGTCVDLSPCAGGCALDLSGSAICVETVSDCDALRAIYDANSPSALGIGRPGDCAAETCNVVREHCAIGLGDCWSWGAPKHQSRVNAVAEQWQAVGCTATPRCDECSPPGAACETGSDFEGCILIE